MTGAVVDLTTYTDSDLDALRVQVLTEQERRRLIAEAPAQQAAVAAQYAAAVATAAPTPWASLTDRVGPGQRVIWTDGNTWRNTSGAWLPTTATPATWPQGWAQETGLPPTVTAWAAGQAVKVGDLRSEAGKAYRCLQAHTTQVGWEPSKVPALWTPQG